MTDLRTEYPRPQLRRDSYLSLNGTWEFETDNTRSGMESEVYKKSHLSGKITVPYCPESTLSGIGNTDFINAVWYRKSVTMPEDFKNKRVILHVDACDYASTVFVNGIAVGCHRGGYTPFSFDVTDKLISGENSFVIYAEDDPRSRRQPIGKQSARLYSAGCFYTRVTGIWQSVWLEAVPAGHILSMRQYPNISAPAVTLDIKVTAAAIGENMRIVAMYKGKTVGTAEAVIHGENVTVTVPLTEKHLWEIGNGRLYDLTLSLSGGDDVTSYFGLREIGWDKNGMKLNGKRFFGRYILDQGYYPDGIYTAPSDARLKQDILDSIALGFNGARAHEKIFEPRYLYHADTLGYLVFGEFPGWGLDISRYDILDAVLPEWLEEVERDFSHPCIIGWCPFNETWDVDGRKQCDELIRTVYRVTKAVDVTRPCIDTSGYYHVETDIFDVHAYSQDPAEFAEQFGKDGTVYPERINAETARRQKYDPEKCFMVSEFGGIGWSLSDKAWSYGNAPKTAEEFVARYKGLVDVLLDCPHVSGFCYTQLTDVEQEQNGLLTYDRWFKFPPEVIRAITARKAGIEETEE